MHISMAVEVILGAVVWLPIIPIVVVVTGMLAVMVTTPATMQVAMPLPLMVATMVSEDIHRRPSAGVSMRVLPLSNLPMAVNAAVGIELIETVAVDGLTDMLINIGWPLPQLSRRAAAAITLASAGYFISHLGQLGWTEVR